MYQFIKPASILVNGPSQTGKSFFTRKLVNERFELIDPCNFTQILWFFPLEIIDPLPGVKYYRDIPDLETIPSNTLLILDDSLTELLNTPSFTNLIVKDCHHKNFVCIYISHNLFAPSKYGRTATINFNYIVLFPNSRDRLTVSNLARQTVLGSKLLHAYQEISKDIFQPLILDFTTRCQDKYRIRSHILKDDIVSRYYD